MAGQTASLLAPSFVPAFRPGPSASTKKRPSNSFGESREVTTTAGSRSRSRLHAVTSDPPSSPSLPNLEDIATPFIGEKPSLNEGIASFYDESSGLWEAQWGEHMHHGYYPNGADRSDHAQAQVDMIDESLAWAGIDSSTTIRKMVDVGCGIGGSSRHIARRFGCVSEGITLSPVQVGRATALSREALRDDNDDLQSQLHYQVADALRQPFEDNSFDLVWSMESGEHMPDKGKFVNELTRVCAPGGRVLIVTWCHRNLEEGESSLPKSEQFLLDRICDAYYLPKWCSVDDYETLFKQNGLQNVKTNDWSDEVKPFWKAVVSVALTVNGILGLLKAGPQTVRGGLVMPLMQKGLRDGTIKFNLITGTKK